MASYVLDSAQYAAWRKRLARNFRPAAIRGIVQGATRAKAYIVKQTRKAPPANPNGVGSGGAVNTGEFIRGWAVVSIRDGARIQNGRPYASIIEYGRRPGSKMPPLGPLMQWVQRRLKIGRVTARSSAKRQASQYAAARSLAFVIARAIGRRGLIGRRILTSPEAKREILRMVREETMRELSRARAPGG